MSEGREKVYSSLRVEVEFPEPFLTADYTGKLVKTVLLASNPALAEVFEGKMKVTPKPLRITPLLKEGDEAIYPKVVVTSFGRSKKPSNSPTPIQVKGRYYFYIGYESSLKAEVHKAIAGLFSGVQFEYGKFKVKVRAVGMQEENYEDFPLNFSEVRVKFVTPCLFKDPFEKLSDLEKEKARRFLPFPPFIFSTNVFEVFRATYKRNVIRLAYGLIESHNNLNTVTKVWYYYNGDWLPGVVGYAKFFLRKGVNEIVLKSLRKIFIHANIMGVGTGRAAGFGFARVTAK